MTLQVTEVSNTLVWYTSPDGSVATLNPLWQAFTGQAYDDYAGWGWLDAIHPDDRATVRALWDAAAASAEPLTLRYRLHRRDGEYRHVVAQGAPVVDDGKVTQWVGFVIDVTESLQAQAARRVSEERLRILDEIGQATRHLQDGDAVMAATARILGQALGATRCAYADVDSDSDRFTIRSDWAVDGVPSSAGVYSLDLFGPQATSNLRQGRHLVVNDVDAELGDDGGARMFNAIGIKAIICAGLVKDGRLVAMMAVHQAQPRRWTPDEVTIVSEVVDRCWAHIERVRDAAMLKEQDVRKDEFIATLAHELRNPLAPIKYAVAIAARQNPSPALADKLAVIDRQVSVMARLIDDLLDVSRINRGLIELQREDAQLDGMVARALEATEALLSAQSHQVEVRVPAGITVHVDPTRLVQVVGNLITNAAKYTPKGGRIDVEAVVADGRVVLLVRDTGMGIAPADQGRLFTMFTQLPHTKSRAQGGLGLGLALVKNLMEMHGGAARVSSPGVGQGSTFSIELPLSESPMLAADADGAAAAPGTADHLAREPVRAQARVLVVEDNDDGRETLIELLRDLGYEVQGVASGPDAVHQVAQHVPHLVLLDLGLPGMDGVEVAKALRSQYPPQQMAIVALTGWGAKHDRARTEAAGFDEHLTKPIQPTVLAQAVRRGVERVSARGDQHEGNPRRGA
jgi:PAS domain S-box-containing protein